MVRSLFDIGQTIDDIWNCWKRNPYINEMTIHSLAKLKIKPFKHTIFKFGVTKDGFFPLNAGEFAIDKLVVVKQNCNISG